MKFFSANLDNLRKLYIDELQHLHSAETQITEALPKMIEAATDPQLKRALENHLHETENQVSRLDELLNQSEGAVDQEMQEHGCPHLGRRGRNQGCDR